MVLSTECWFYPGALENLDMDGMTWLSKSVLAKDILLIPWHFQIQKPNYEIKLGKRLDYV